MDNVTPIKIPASPLMQRLGYGTGVTVFRMNRAPKLNFANSPWAVKKVNKEIDNDSEVGARLRGEASILRKLNHPNVVGFRAFTRSADGQDCLAMEACSVSLGDLIEQRSDVNGEAFLPNEILKMVADISSALVYLHNDVMLLHGDIKSYNILVKKNFEICKLCDFGVSLPVNDKGELDIRKAGSDTEYFGTKCWAPKEVLVCSQIITTKADIFSLGLTVWEMCALSPPHAELANESVDDENDSSIINLDDSVIPLDSSVLSVKGKNNYGTRPAIPDISTDMYNEVLAIFYICTEEDYTKRPTASALKSILDIIKID